jgi:hypothetical protein
VLDGGLARFARRTARAAARPELLLVALATAACAPVLLRGVPWGHDTRPHILWSHHFSQQLAAGELYPRWLVDVAHGFGAPVFFVYPPFTYYVAAALGPLLPGADLLPWRLGVTAWLAVCASALAMYLWLRAHVGRAGALFGAALYTLLPYHLIVDLHIRVAMAELVAFTWPPLILASLDGASARPARAVALGALPAALLFLTHAPTALTALPLCFAWSLLLSVRQRSPRPAGVALVQAGLGAGLAGAYLATALSHGPYIGESELFENLFHYSLWFIRLDETRPWMILVHAQAVALVLACVASVAALRVAARRTRPARELAWLVHAAAAAAVVGFGLMLSPSEPLWRGLPLLQRIQFPWRLSSHLVLCASACLGGLYAHGLRAFPTWARGLSGGAAAVVALLLAGNLWVAEHTRVFDVHYKPLTRTRVAKLLRETRSQPEHWVPRASKPDPLFADGERVAFVSGSGEARVEEWRPRHLSVSIRADEPVRLALRQQFYPGWRAELEGQPCCAPVDALRREYGILAVDLPAGTHRVRFTLGPTPNERLGWLASGASLAALAAVSAAWIRSDRKRRTARAARAARPGA